MGSRVIAAMLREAAVIETECEEWKARALAAEADRDRWMSLAVSSESLRSQMMLSSILSGLFSDENSHV
jgi:hypothetical protein